ncbi:hypothetical protein K9U39_02475 [Rhodoblastus acidophilus]|uniref:DUF805 domain-containing protein n=1 Tax=Candidatus Rhodoblastus alkanivorans TaxID=2954117 RepID=A0ABS9Z4A6_9HYPH|nr:hypothetical protein [Candidatus Rhodoblastus alkanivorans]MCI4680641.1 hypothetical protein [Candidatus Rhodoblastus alkanivorans]MCI4682513.1 hypothetical protein [Candidatus Rhodoblastus alkanivorans]MDI4639819.1 hypothetical protein [Rhodoblastus acidophilus]
MDRAAFRFLFRESEGTISAPVWRRWTLALTGFCAALALIWSAISPWTHRDLATQGLFEAKAFFAFVYLLLYAFAVLLAQVSQYNLSAKRFRALGLNPAWAGAWPLSAFLTGAVFFAEPHFFGVIPPFAPWLLLFAATAGFVAQFFELGLRPDGTRT